MQKMHLVQQIDHAGGEYLIGIICLKRGQTDTVRKNRMKNIFYEISRNRQFQSVKMVPGTPCLLAFDIFLQHNKRRRCKRSRILLIKLKMRLPGKHYPKPKLSRRIPKRNRKILRNRIIRNPKLITPLAAINTTIPTFRVFPVTVTGIISIHFR